MTTVADPLETLRHVQIAPRLIEEARPITECLEWRLSELYWNDDGTGGFVRGEVPYTITSSGTLSANAAKLLFAACAEHPPEDRLDVLEIGAGTGLFARLFLDEFARLCQREGTSWHQRLTYFVTDRSPRSLDEWRQHGLFDGHPVVTARTDALQPLLLELPDARRELAHLRAVFCNYCLDSLPAAVLRKGDDGVEELCVRTHLAAHRRSKFTLDQLRVMARDLDRALLPLVDLFEFEAVFEPCTRPYPYASEALSFAHDWPRVILNWGAIQCLKQVMCGLDAHGFVLINDYGVVSADGASAMGATQRFGGSAALGLNFPFLDHHFSSHGSTVLRPDLDERLPIHTRLIARHPMEATGRAFHAIFDWQAQRVEQGPQEEARQRIAAGAFEAARQQYEVALSFRRHDWALLGEIAEFLIRQVSDYQAGLTIAAAALDINPWYSVWLWNVYGDALYALERFDEAHAAYCKGEQMEPHDPRTLLNLGYSYAQRGESEAALQALARGLAHDRAGVFRDRLLEKQQQIISSELTRYTAEQEWLARRTVRLSSG
jgi:tetratricopeptide (TPR) repeat protein